MIDRALGRRMTVLVLCDASSAGEGQVTVVRHGDNIVETFRSLPAGEAYALVEAADGGDLSGLKALRARYGSRLIYAGPVEMPSSCGDAGQVIDAEWYETTDSGGRVLRGRPAEPEPKGATPDETIACLQRIADSAESGAARVAALAEAMDAVMDALDEDSTEDAAWLTPFV